MLLSTVYKLNTDLASTSEPRAGGPAVVDAFPLALSTSDNFACNSATLKKLIHNRSKMFVMPCRLKNILSRG